MQKDPKHTAFVCIVAGGFIVILLLWLPTFVASVKSIIWETGMSSSQMTKKISDESQQIFDDASRQFGQTLQKLEEEQKKDALSATIRDILEEKILDQQQAIQDASSSLVAAPLGAVSSSVPIRVVPFQIQTASSSPATSLITP